MIDLTLDVIRSAVAGTAAAFRCVTEYEPAGGPGDKVFPPTYEGGKYATEKRVDPQTGEIIDCVLLDSVQSQANRMELALLEAMDEADGVELPLLRVAFTDVPKPITVTSLEAPHRIADAIFRDSQIMEDGQWCDFRQSSKGSILDRSDNKQATGLFGLCPTALVFGLWDSTGPRGGLGAKFQRAVVSDLVGYGAEAGCKPTSRIDPLQVFKEAGPVFRAATTGWTLNKDKALKQSGKPVLWGLTKDRKYVVYDEKKDQDEGKPSKINHGNVTPSLHDDKTKQLLPGGFTIRYALQRTVISLPALRRLRFPIPDQPSADQPTTNLAARTTLMTLALAAATLAREQGADLRSRCQLVPTGPFIWELLDQPGAEPIAFSLTGTQARALLKEAITAAKDTGLPWESVIDLTPSEDLVELVRRSQRLAAQTTGED